MEENCIENIKNKHFDEIIILTRQFQCLLQKYTSDIVNNETLNYFKAKKDIDRIDHILTTGFSPVNIEGKILVIYYIFVIF